MKEHLLQKIHSGSRKKQEKLTIPAESVQPRPPPHTLYKALAPPLLDRFGQIFVQDAEINYEKVGKLQIPTPNRLGVEIEKPPLGRICHRKEYVGLRECK